MYSVCLFSWRSWCQAAHSGSSCSPWWHHLLQQVGTLPAPASVSCVSPLCAMAPTVLSNIPKPSEACVRRRWDDTPVRNVIYTWVPRPRPLWQNWQMLIDFWVHWEIIHTSETKTRKDASYFQTDLTQVSQLSQRYQLWWKKQKQSIESIGHRRTLLILVGQEVQSSYDVSSWSLSKRPSAIKVSGREFQRWNLPKCVSLSMDGQHRLKGK